MRYFRTADAELYEAIRSQLDAAWGHPTADGKTLTCIDPVEVAPRDGLGNVLLAVRDEFVGYEPAASLVPRLLATKDVEEISEAVFGAAVSNDVP